MRREVFIKNLWRFTLFLIVTGSSVAQANHAGNPIYSKYSEEEVFHSWLVESYERDYSDRGRFITWLGEFSKDEKEMLLNYMEKEEKTFYVTRESVVAKGFLDGSGRFIYVIDLVVKDPKPSYYGQVVCLVEKKNNKYTITPLSSPIHLDTGIRLNFLFIDVDGDGLNDIIEERKLEGDPEAPSARDYVSAIYKNNKMKFNEIYRQQNYYFLKFKDLDNDGRLEILETVSELPYETYQEDPKWRWINIYQWNGKNLVKVNKKFFSFYLEQEKLYKSLLKDASAKVEENRKRGITNIWNTTERAMKAYIERIEEMKRSSEKKPK